MKNDTSLIENVADPGLFNLILLLYLISLFFIAFVASRLKKNRIFLYSFVVLAIGVLTFEPGFPSSAHDLSYFFGPIYELSQGKTIFTQVSSQYGFLSTLTLAFFTKLRFFNPYFLPLVVWLLYILQYFLSFYILLKAGKSIVIALIGLLSIITINYYSLYHYPAAYPQIGPLRWLPLVLALYLLQRIKSLTGIKIIFFITVLSLWNVEVGISLILAYTLTLFLHLLVKKISLRILVRSLFFMTFFIFSLLLAINLLHLSQAQLPIDFIASFSRLRMFAVSGVAMIPMPWRTHFWFVPLTYFASIIYYLRQQPDRAGVVTDEALRKADFRSEGKNLAEEKSHEQQNLPELLLFSANIMLFASIYYVGRSHPHNLFHVSIFFLLNVFLFIIVFLKKTPKLIPRTFILLLIATVFIVIPAQNRKESLSGLFTSKLNRVGSGSIFRSLLQQQVNRYYFVEAEFIRYHFPQDSIVLLSVDDTYLLPLTGKKNLLWDNPQSGLATAESISQALKWVAKICPEKIVATCTLFGCPSYPTFNHQAFDVQEQLLLELENVCEVKYKPVKCSSKLCLAES